MSCKEICSEIFFPVEPKRFWVIELKDRHKKALRLVCTFFFSLLMVRLRRLIVWHHEKMLMHEKIFKSDLLKTSIAKLCDAFCLPWKFAHNFFFLYTYFFHCMSSLNFFLRLYMHSIWIRRLKWYFCNEIHTKKWHTKRKGMCNKKR